MSGLLYREKIARSRFVELGILPVRWALLVFVAFISQPTGRPYMPYTCRYMCRCIYRYACRYTGRYTRHYVVMHVVAHVVMPDVRSIDMHAVIEETSIRHYPSTDLLPWPWLHLLPMALATSASTHTQNEAFIRTNLNWQQGRHATTHAIHIPHTHVCI